MADTRVVDLDADLVGLGRCDFHVFNGEVFAGFPGDGGLGCVNGGVLVDVGMRAGSPCR